MLEPFMFASEKKSHVIALYIWSFGFQKKQFQNIGIYDIMKCSSNSKSLFENQTFLVFCVNDAFVFRKLSLSFSLSLSLLSNT